LTANMENRLGEVSSQFLRISHASGECPAGCWETTRHGRDLNRAGFTANMTTLKPPTKTGKSGRQIVMKAVRCRKPRQK